VCEEDTANTEVAPPSAGNSLTSTVSADDDTEALDRAPDDSNDGGDKVGEP
jgi:hypothetical protein